MRKISLLIAVVVTLSSCLSSKEANQRDNELIKYRESSYELEAQRKQDSIKIDSLVRIGDLQKQVSERRDYWFFEYTKTKRDLDSLYKVMYD